MTQLSVGFLQKLINAQNLNDIITEDAVLQIKDPQTFIFNDKERLRYNFYVCKKIIFLKGQPSVIQSLK